MRFASLPGLLWPTCSQSNRLSIGCSATIIAGSITEWLGREKLIAALRKEKFDIALLLQNAFDAAWIAWRSGIPERIGYARDGRGALLTKSIRVPAQGEIPKHESHYYLELLRRAEWIESLPPESRVFAC